MTRYRQASGYTVEAMAQVIHKSKSTVSKYERGEISLDVETLLEISQALHVTPNELLRFEDTAVSTSEEAGLFSHREYLYIYDGRLKRIFRCALDHFYGEKAGFMKVPLFYDVLSLQDVGKCRCLYTGQMSQHAFIRSYVFTNQNNPMEQVLLYSLDSLDRSQYRLGGLLGLSSYAMVPVFMKALLFQTQQREDEMLLNRLLLTKEDLRSAKRYNILILDQQDL